MHLEAKDLWHHSEKEVASPTDVALLAECDKKTIKAKQVMLNSMKDHLIPHITGRKTDKDTFNAPVSLY